MSAIDHWTERAMQDAADLLEKLFGGEAEEAITRWAERWIEHHEHRQATALTLSVQGGPDMGFTINTTTGAAELQFVDSAGHPVAGPNDTVTGDPVAPEVTSSDTTVVTVAASVADATTPGLWTAALTVVAEGAFTIAPAVLTNSDGSVIDLPLPAPVSDVVGPGSVAGLTLSLTS